MCSFRKWGKKVEIVTLVGFGLQTQRLLMPNGVKMSSLLSAIVSCWFARMTWWYVNVSYRPYWPRQSRFRAERRDNRRALGKYGKWTHLH